MPCEGYEINDIINITISGISGNGGLITKFREIP